MRITLTFQGIGSGSVTPTGDTKPEPFSDSAFTFSFTTDSTLISNRGPSSTLRSLAAGP